MVSLASINLRMLLKKYWRFLYTTFESINLSNKNSLSIVYKYIFFWFYHMYAFPLSSSSLNFVVLYALETLWKQHPLLCTVGGGKTITQISVTLLAASHRLTMTLATEFHFQRAKQKGRYPSPTYIVQVGRQVVDHDPKPFRRLL